MLTISVDFLPQMDRDAELLKDKVLLLLARERELLTLRRGHARISAWLTVAQSLAELVSSRASLDETYRALAHKLKSQLEFQKVIFFAVPPEAAQLRALVDQEGVGLCNAPDGPAAAELSAAVGLHRFMWCRLVAGGGTPTLLLVVGYDREKAAFYSPFDEADFGHFRSMGQHLGLLLRNASLIKQLELEKDRLEDLNQTLEHRVADRTEQIGRVNRGLADALAAVHDRERRLRDDLEQARLFQQSILPLLPRFTDYDLDWVYRPLEMVGGDIFDVYQMAPGHLRVFLADAAGHGVQASLRTIVLKSEYDRIKAGHPTPARLFEDFNRRLAQQYSPGEMVCTACCFDLVAGEPGSPVQLRYVNAAHPGLLCVRGEDVRELYQDGPFLGLRADIDLFAMETTLERGDALFAFSDGLCDQPNAQGLPFPLGVSAVQALRAGGSMQEVLDRIEAAFDGFRGSRAAGDDITLIGVRLT